MTPGAFHRHATSILSAAMLAVGIALIVEAAVASGSAPVIRGLLGLLFAAAGAGRLYVLRRGRP